MADKYLNNNACYTLLNAAYKQIVGDTAVATQNLSDFVENGAAYDSLISDNAWKDQFCKALLQQCVKNMYLDTEYTSAYKSPFRKDSRRFGAITQMISCEVGDVQESHAWQQFVSGSSQVGVYTLYLPSVSAKTVGHSASFELPIAISDEQMTTAFKNEEELATFVGFVQMTVQNGIEVYLEACEEANRNNFMGEKIAYAASQGATGVHVLDLVALYRAETGDQTITTAEAFMADDKCMRFAAETIDKYSLYLTKMSSLFNVDGKKKFCPKDRLVCQLLQHFYSRMKSVSYSDAFNYDFVKLPDFQSVPYWQGFGVADATTGAIDFDEVSTIKVKTSSGETVSQSGIVGFLCDEYGIMTTILSQRVAVTRHDPEALTQYYYQFRRQNVNMLGQNALVFVLNDVQTQQNAGNRKK